MLAQERGDLGNRELMLLHMEQEIAALADTEIIRVARHRFHRRVQQLPAATTDVARRRTRPLPRKTRPCRADLLPRDLAVEPDMHQPKGSQHGVQNPPSCHWICKVVQHPACLDDVERAPERRKLEEIRLGIFDIAHAERARHSRGIGETGEAEIDRKHPRVREQPRGDDRLLPRPAARNKDVDGAVGRKLAK